MLENQFLPKVVQAKYNTFTCKYNTFTVQISYTYLYLKYFSVEKVMNILILQSNTFLIALALPLLEGLANHPVQFKSFLMVTTKKLKERRRKS